VEGSALMWMWIRKRNNVGTLRVECGVLGLIACDQTLILN
jgi:hypothetical protein